MLTLRSLALGLAALVFGAWGLTAYYTLQPSSRVWVEGTSNVHDWTCEAKQIAGTVSAEEALTDGVTGVTVTIPVQSLDCDNGTMDKNLRKALDAKANPAIRYTLATADLAAPDAEGWFDVKTTGRLTISGKTKTVQMGARGKAAGDGAYRFTGSVKLRMTDFGVDPPTAMLGAMKTGDAVTVHFDVTVGR
jgi:polyisoprenoid-binding protein YceI